MEQCPESSSSLWQWNSAAIHRFISRSFSLDTFIFGLDINHWSGQVFCLMERELANKQAAMCFEAKTTEREKIDRQMQKQIGKQEFFVVAGNEFSNCELNGMSSQSLGLVVSLKLSTFWPGLDVDELQFPHLYRFVCDAEWFKFRFKWRTGMATNSGAAR